MYILSPIISPSHSLSDSKPPRLNKLVPALVLVLAMLIIVAIGPALFPDQNIQSLLVCGLVTSIIMVCFGILSQQECRDAVNWEVYVTIACAFGIGTAMENSVRKLFDLNELLAHFPRI